MEMTLSVHRCKVCGTRWLLWPDAIHGGGWNLLDKYQRPGGCCDNVAMGDQIEHLRDIPLASAPVAVPAPRMRRVCDQCGAHADDYTKDDGRSPWTSDRCPDTQGCDGTMQDEPVEGAVPAAPPSALRDLINRCTFGGKVAGCAYCTVTVDEDGSWRHEVECIVQELLNLEVEAAAPSAAAPPSEPFDFVKRLQLAQGQVQSSPLYKRFIDGTPLENDIAVWMVTFAAQSVRDCVAAASSAASQTPAPPLAGAPTQPQDKKDVDTRVDRQ